MIVSAVLVALTIAASPADLIDMETIRNTPLAAEVLETRTEDGIVIEHVEFTGIDDPEGTPIRTFGILAYPQGGKNLPAVMWCQGGMADAGVAFPKIFAKKGYISLSITLPKKTWAAWSAFDTATPRNANYIRLAAAHMRGITYLAARPETDPARIGVGGASYGGVFSTLVTGLDPRVVCGMSFFSGGNHHLGTNLPQFTKLNSLAEIEIFKRTGDGAFYHARRNVPFLWGIAANDNWFYFPAVTRTAADAISPGKRLAIYPHWTHGFPEVMDNQLIDWFDIHLLKARKPYNAPADLQISVRDGKLIGEWTWSGENPVKKAELVVCYGRPLPWHGWVHRLHQPFPATIDGQTARAEIPIPEPETPFVAYGNIIDENDVLTSTLPVTTSPADHGITTKTDMPALNGYPWGDFEEETEVTFGRFGYRFGTFDEDTFREGKQSFYIEPGLAKPVHLKLLNVYERSHRLSFWAKAASPTAPTFTVKAVAPANWKNPAVQALLATIPGAASWSEEMTLPVFTISPSLGTDWQKVALECPFDGTPVEGYRFTLAFPETNAAAIWIDDFRFEPKWEDN